MTTIAACGGRIAGDGVETSDDMIVNRTCAKVVRLYDGSVMAGAGNVDCIMALTNALKKKLPTPNLGDKVSALRYDTDGVLWLYEGMSWEKIQKPFYAIGSGACYALAAMMADADAVLACKIGAELDPWSGGKIRSMRVKRVKRHKRRKPARATKTRRSR